MLEVIRARRGPVTLVGIRIDPEEPFVVVGGTQQLTAYPRPSKANKGSITWSSAWDVITVDKDGVITGKRSEYTTTIYATSDAGPRGSVIARCGYDVTALSLPISEITIEGIQGIVQAVSVTPSNATMISFGSMSDDPTIAEYQYLSTSFGNGRRLWGLGVGETNVKIYGRSGKAEHNVKVTVTPVSVESIEIRGNGDSILTDQGDYIPPILEKRIVFVNQQDSYVDVFFFPFNTTQRNIIIESSDESVADIYEAVPQSDLRNFGRGTLRKKRLIIHPKAVGDTTVTVTAENGAKATFDIHIAEVGSIRYTATASSTQGSSGTLRISGSVSLTEFTGWSFGFTYTSNAGSTSGAGETGGNPGTSTSRSYFRSDGSKTGMAGNGYIWYYDQNGNTVAISNITGTVSW